MFQMKKVLLGFFILLALNPLHVFAETADEAFNKGLSEQDKGNRIEALQYYSQAIQLNPKYTEAYFKRAEIKHSLTDTTGAIQDFTQVIMLNPKYAEAYHNRALRKGQLGDKEGFYSDFDKAKQLYIESGDMDEYQKAIDMQNFYIKLKGF